MSELKADGGGIIWIGDAEDPMALIHSQTTGILLSGNSLVKWNEQGQQKWYTERTSKNRQHEVNICISTSLDRRTGTGRNRAVQMPGGGTDKPQQQLGDLDNCRRS